MVMTPAVERIIRSLLFGCCNQNDPLAGVVREMGKSIEVWKVCGVRAPAARPGGVRRAKRHPEALPLVLKNRTSPGAARRQPDTLASRERSRTAIFVP